MTPEIRERVEALDSLHEFRRRCELAEIAWEMLPELHAGRDIQKLSTRLSELLGVWYDSLPMLERAIEILERD